jgi:hypothetical protein
MSTQQNFLASVPERFHPRNWRGNLQRSWVMLRRTMSSDFQQLPVLDEEKARFAALPVPVVDPMAQGFLVWRRSLLATAAGLLLLYAFNSLVGIRTVEHQLMEVNRAQLVESGQFAGDSDYLEEQARQQTDQYMALVGSDNLDIINGLDILIRLSVLAAAVVITVASVKWYDVRLSRRLSRIGWLVLFGAPFLLAMIPASAMMDFTHLPAAEAAQASMLLGGTVGVSFFLALVPKVISLLPGVMRSAMTVKTMLPEATSPGWIVAIMAPLYGLILLVVLATVNQVQFDVQFLFGMGFLIAAAVFYVVRAPQLVRAHTEEEAVHVVARARLQTGLLNGVGALLLALYLLNLPNLDFGSTANVFFGIIGNVLLMTLIGTELTLRFLKQASVDAAGFRDSHYEAALTDKLGRLAAHQLTDEEGVMAGSVGAGGSQAGGRSEDPRREVAGVVDDVGHRRVGQVGGQVVEEEKRFSSAKAASRPPDILRRADPPVVPAVVPPAVPPAVPPVVPAVVPPTLPVAEPSAEKKVEEPVVPGEIAKVGDEAEVLPPSEASPETPVEAPTESAADADDDGGPN